MEITRTFHLGLIMLRMKLVFKAMRKIKIEKIVAEPLGFEFPNVFLTPAADLHGSVPIFDENTIKLMAFLYSKDKEFRENFTYFYLLKLRALEIIDFYGNDSFQNEELLYIATQIEATVQLLIKPS